MSMLKSLITLGNYLLQHQNGIDVRWTAHVIEEIKQQHDAALEAERAGQEEFMQVFADLLRDHKRTHHTGPCILCIRGDDLLTKRAAIRTERK